MKADAYKYNQRFDPKVEAVQWYFGSRSFDFYIQGVRILKNALKPYGVEVSGAKDGDFIPAGTPALTFTFEGDNRFFGGMLENEIYHSLWYRSTVYTLLIQAKEHLEKNGFSPRPAPKIRRGCATPEQADIAEQMFEQVFFDPNIRDGKVADHANILINGETFAFDNHNAVMIDTHDEAEAVKKLHYNVILIDSGDMEAKARKYYKETDAHICLLDTVTRENWFSIVESLSELEQKHRIGFSIGSEVFQKVSRDDLDLIYKPCARKIGGVWEGISKQSTGKETLSGFQGV